MKHTKHKNRRSFGKWAMSGQRCETQTMEKLNIRRSVAISKGRNPENIGKNNGPLKHSVPARNLSTQFSLHPHSILKEPCGAKAKVISSTHYNPDSRR